MSSRDGMLPILLLLSMAGGGAALIYEVVWLQMLQLVVGSTAVSVGALLATFMAGMCIGSLALPVVVSPRRHPLRVYAALEAGIGVCGIAIWIGMPLAGRLGFAAVLYLLPPTLLMGATLPALSRWVRTTPSGVSWLGFLYGANIAGAVLGCLLAGFYLLRVHDTAAATFVAAAINWSVAAVALVLAARAPRDAITEESGKAGGSWPVYVAIGLSGLCALGAEVVWTRLLSLMLGATVYTFALILAGFLLGLGIGSGLASMVLRRVAAASALGACQILLAAAVAWASYALARVLPYWKVEAGYGWDFARCLLVVLPAAILWGASFPLALAVAAGNDRDPARVVGRVYAANTIGAIAGALGFSLVLIPVVGSQQSQRLLVAFAMVAALFMTRRYAPIWLMAAALAIWIVPGVPWGVVAYGRRLPTRVLPGNLLYLGEGRNASIAVSELYGTRSFHISGKVEASTEQQDMRLQRMLGHIPALLHSDPRSVLVVGCGAGVTAGSFVVHPSVQRIVLCELEPLVTRAAARYFGSRNNHVIDDGRVEIVHDDARHYVLTTRDKFDILTSDPIHPWVKGSAVLYTKEYFEMCKRRLNPGGLITQWVPLYESTRAAVQSEIATFLEVFPDGTIWANETAFGEGYDIVLLGQAGPIALDAGALQRRLDRADHAPVVRSLKELGIANAAQFMTNYTGRGLDLGAWLKGAQINRDRNLRLQYLAGSAPASQGAIFLYEEMQRALRR